MSSIHKLNQKLINQIAAGEVVERPASVIKELVENSIDADSSRIEIAIKSGGIEEIVIKDNGIGMSKEDLELAVDSHTTSKIEELEDILKINTLGFRGEALASIASVSKMEVISMERSGEHAYKIAVDGGNKTDAEITSGNQGTTIIVRDLFFNVPARRKFLKTPETEYRKILDTLIPITLINPQVHFVFKSQDREILNLPALEDISRGSIHPSRLTSVFKGLDFVEVFYDGENTTVGGVIAHPKHHKSQVKNRYVFINGRPIWDSGIIKAVSVGANRFIPVSEKVPFAISINIPSQYVDVNVHPQKSEVRFANPYRVYSAVEKAVRASYEKDLAQDKSDMEFSRFRQGGVRSGLSHNEFIEGNNNKIYKVDESIRFSRMLLEDSGGGSDYGNDASKPYSDNTFSDGEAKNPSISIFSNNADSSASDDKCSNINIDSNIHSDSSKYQLQDSTLSAYQFLNRYIITSLSNELWIIDQHAAAERIRFEKLLADYEKKLIESQMLIDRPAISLSDSAISFLKENSKTLESLGYTFEFSNDEKEEAVFENLSSTESSSEDTIKLLSVPAIMREGNHQEVLVEILDELEQIEDFADRAGILKGKYRDDIIATMACHSSVRMNRRLSAIEATGIVRDLLKCNNSYSCPHGRPIIWKLSQKDIEKNFER